MVLSRIRTVLVVAACLTLVAVGSTSSAQTFSTADMEGTWWMHRLLSGTVETDPQVDWSYGKYDISAEGVLTELEFLSAGGDTSSGLTGTRVSVASDGTLSLSVMPNSRGAVSADRNIAVLTWNEEGGGAVMAVLTRVATSYSTADLAGTWTFNALSAGTGGGENGWMRSVLTIDAGGIATQVSVLTSEGDTATGDPVTASVAADGEVTVAEEADMHGALSVDKDFMTMTAPAGDGGYALFLWVRQEGTFVADDAEDLWRFAMLSAGDTPSWGRGTVSVAADGTAGGRIVFSQGEISEPDGTFSIDAGGIITHAGGDGGIPGFEAIMSPDRSLVVGTSGTPGDDGQYGLMVWQRVPAGDLSPMEGTWWMHGLLSGTDLDDPPQDWAYGKFEISAAGVLTDLEFLDGGGSTSSDIGGSTVSVMEDDTISLSAFPDSWGALSANGDIALVTWTDGGGAAGLMVLTRIAPSYSLADLAGTWTFNTMGTGTGEGGGGWARGTGTIDGGGTVTPVSYLSSEGDTDVSPPVTASITADGAVSVAEQPVIHGALSVDKDFMTMTMQEGDGGPALFLWLRNQGTFAADDLQDRWRLSTIMAGDSPGWGRGTMGVANDGSPGGLVVHSHGEISSPDGTFSIDAGGVLTHSGGDGGLPGFEGLMSPDKSLVVGTSGTPETGGQYVMMVWQRAPAGEPSPLEGSWWMHSLLSGSDLTEPQHDWAYGKYDISGNGILTELEFLSAGGDTSSGLAGTTISATADGRLALSAFLNSWGTINTDGDIMAFTETAEEEGPTVMIVFTRIGESYAIADLVGTWRFHVLNARADGGQWARGVISVDGTGVGAQLSILSSDGSTDTSPPAQMSIAGDGEITVVGDPDLHAAVNADKDFLAMTMPSGEDGSNLLLMVREEGTFSSADLGDAWRFQILQAGSEYGWIRGFADIDGAGVMTGSFVQSDGETGAPDATFAIAADGTVTDTSGNLYALEGIMSADKDLIIATNSAGPEPDSFYLLHIWMRKPPPPPTPMTWDDTLTGGTTADAYTMISSPCDPNDNDVEAVLGDDLGAYDPTAWRLFRYDPATGTYREHPRAGTMDPGKAFWLISRATTAVDISCATVSVSGPFPVVIGPGWNQIANPYDFPISWENCLVTDGISTTEPVTEDNLVSEDLYAWAGIEYETTGEMDPGTGYWAKNNTNADVTLLMPPDAVLAKGTRPAGRRPAPGDAPPPPPSAVIMGGGGAAAGGGCFIATAAWGAPSETGVAGLSRVRDELLAPCAAGGAVVRAYYATSPPLADLLSTSETLRAAARSRLDP